MGKMSGEFAPDSPRSDAPRPAPAPSPQQTPQQPGPPPIGGQDGGGSFRLDTDQLQSLIGEWTGLQADLQAAEQKAQPLIHVAGPGREGASGGVSRTINQSGAAYLKHNKEMQVYVEAYIRKLNDALHGHTANDQNHADDLNRKQG